MGHEVASALVETFCDRNAEALLEAEDCVKPKKSKRQKKKKGRDYFKRLENYMFGGSDLTLCKNWADELQAF